MTRPTPVTVIGWVWCILGLWMASSGALALTMSLSRPLPTTIESPWAWIPVIAPIQIVIGLTGAVAGFRFLRLEPRTRRVLEILTALVLVSVVAVNIFVGSIWMKSVPDEAGVFRYFGAFVAVISTLFYGGGLVAMWYHLRSAVVRDALAPRS